MSRHVLLILACLTLSGCTLLSKVGQVIRDPSIPVGGPDDQPSQFSLSLHAASTLNVNPASATEDLESTASTAPVPLAVNLSAEDPLELAVKLHSVIEQLGIDYPALSPVTADEEPEPQHSPASPPLARYADSDIRLGLPAQPTPPVQHQVASPVKFQVLQLKNDALFLDATYEQLIEDLDDALASSLVRVDDYRLMPGQFKFVDFEALDPGTRYIAVFAHYHDPDHTIWKRTLRVEPRGYRHAVLIHFDASGAVLERERH